MKTGRRYYDNIEKGSCMNEQYVAICKDEFNVIKEKVSKIEQKIFNGFEDKITNASNGVDRLETKLDKEIKGLRALITSMLLSVIAGSFGIIVTLIMR